MIRKSSKIREKSKKTVRLIEYITLGIILSSAIYLSVIRRSIRGSECESD